MNANLFKQIKNKLKSEFYLMNDEWLRDCVQFYMNQHRNFSNEEILQFVKVQWQLSDLREINNENGSLPHNLSQQNFVTLSENYILQVEQMYDIGTSKYKQLEQIRKIHISEVEESETDKLEKWAPPKKRMMQLKLSDGLQDIIGIEYNHISRLNDLLLPGYKVMIIGPINCRRGVLLLEEGKFMGIGGEVDSLLIPNALENILARALNLPENPDPYNDNESQSNNIGEEKEPKVEDSFFEEDFEINLEEVSRIEDSHSKNNRQLNTNVIKTENKTENRVSTNTMKREDQNCKENIVLDDDCFLKMIDAKQLVKSQVEQKNIVSSFRVLSTKEEDDVIILDDEEVIEDTEYHKNSCKKESHLDLTWSTNEMTSSSSTTHSKSYNKAQETSLPLIGGKRPISVSPSEKVTLKKGKLDKKITEFIEQSNFSEIPKICEFIHDINNEVITDITYRKIRGRVEILGKLAKKDSCWILEATIIDGTGKLEVSFSNEVLENLLGFSVQEFSLKKKLKKNPAIEHELRMSFRTAEQRIKTLDALLELELNTKKKPKVINITDLTQEQKEVTDKRLKYFLSKSNT